MMNDENTEIFKLPLVVVSVLSVVVTGFWVVGDELLVGIMVVEIDTVSVVFIVSAVEIIVVLISSLLDVDVLGFVVSIEFEVVCGA